MMSCIACLVWNSEEMLVLLQYRRDLWIPRLITVKRSIVCSKLFGPVIFANPQRFGTSIISHVSTCGIPLICQTPASSVQLCPCFSVMWSMWLSPNPLPCGPLCRLRSNNWALCRSFARRQMKWAGCKLGCSSRAPKAPCMRHVC